MIEELIRLLAPFSLRDLTTRGNQTIIAARAFQAEFEEIVRKEHVRTLSL